MTRSEILKAATKAVADRGLNYGTPEENFERIARHWNTHLTNRFGVGSNGLASTDVAIMLALVKIARLENDPSHLDSWVDIAGYAACGGELTRKG